MKYIRFVTTKKVHITDDIEDSFRRKKTLCGWVVNCALGDEVISAPGREDRVCMRCSSIAEKGGLS